MTKIRQLWDLFVQAECSSYEKSTWSDIFLSQFLADLHEGRTVEEILNFCNWSGVGTLIGCELLSDIDQVCSQPGNGEELAPLRHHLYTKGWRALAVLLSFGQQNFSCSNELANLLISLYPICLETRGGPREPVLPKAKNKYLHIESKDQVDACFSKSPLRNKFSANHSLLAPRADYFRSHSNASNSRNRRQFQRNEPARPNVDVLTSESENPSDDFDLINKSCALKIKLNPMDFDYFTSVVRSDDDARLDSVLYEPRFRSKHSKKIMPMDFIDDKISEVMKNRVSPFEFSMLVIRLLTSLCRAEQSFSISADNSYPVCSNCVKFALENLCSLQFGSVSTQNLEAHEMAELKSGLTQLLIISLEKVMGCPDITSNVILTGILPMMLKVLEDSVCKLSPDYSTTGSNDESSESYEREKQQEVVFGLMCSIITFLFSLLMQSSDVDRVRNFLELFKIFIESSCGKLVEKTILVLSGNIGRAKKIIDLIGQLVSELKEARKKMVYPHFCKRSKHKRVKGGDELHHHLDLFGAVFTAPMVGSSCQQNCCVSSLFMVLVRLLKSPEKIPPEILNRTLKVMTLCGTCCCFPTKNLIQSLTEIIKLPSQKSRALVFQLLENTIYTELGAYSMQTNAKITCVICFKHESDDLKEEKMSAIEENVQKRFMFKDFASDKASTKSEKSYTSYQSDGSLLEGYHAGKSWLKMELFRELLLSSDFRIVHGVTCHLLKCAPKMNKYAKYTILFKVFFPTFLSSKAQFLNENDEVSIFRILSSLSIFSSLLNNTQLAEQFISQKGLNHVLDLISIQTFSKHCCLVLEKTINIGALTQGPDLRNNSALSMLRKAVDSAMISFFDVFNVERKNKLVELANVSAVMGVKRRTTVENKERDEKRAMDALQSVSTFWRTYANLALCSPTLRKFFSDEVFLTDCNDLMKISLTTMTKGPPMVKNKDSKLFECSESHLFTRLIESLLSFILATSEHTENGDDGKKAIIEKLSETLMNNDLQNVDVRRLADVLLKCSLLQPSRNQIVPSVSTPKLPTLPLWTTWVEDVPELEESEVKTASDSSSLEDNYVTADEGYEADVEIRDNPASAGEVYESNSSCSVTDSITLFTNQEYGYEKNDFKNFYTIAHPQLCHLAIDLLVKLYQDKLSEESRIIRRKESRKIQHSKSKSMSENVFDLKEPIENIAVTRLKERKLNRGRSYSERGTDSPQPAKKEQGATKSVKMSVEEKNKDVEGKCMLSIISTFQRLVSLCRDKSQNCDILCQNGVILKLLTGFGPCLSVKNERFSELQRVILDLVTVLAKHSITTQELTTYLNFFKEENPPVDFLLNPLVSLITSHNPQPNFFLRFPVSAVDDKVSFPTPDIGKTFHLQHKREGIPSCWSCAAISIPISTDLNWSAWGQGFSLSMWLRADRTILRPSPQIMRPRSPQKSASRKVSKAESHISACSTNISDWGMVSDVYTNEDLPRSSPLVPSRMVSLNDRLHIFSIGQENMTLECWTATTSDTLIWRLTRVDSNKGYEVLAESVSEHCLPSGAWHHFSVNVKDYLQRKKTILEVTLIVNGWREVTVLLSFSGLLIRKSRPSSLLLGHQSDMLKENCYLTNVMLFTNPVFTRERSIYLLGLGPNCNNLTDCQVGKRNPNFTSVFSAKTLTSDMAWDLILDEKENNIRELQNHLLLTYCAENPNLVNFYPLVSNAGSLFPGFRPVSAELRASQQQPITVIPNHLSQISNQKYQGIIPSATLIGGSATFLFLFARVVELSDCPEEQAKSLYLLLKLVQSDCDLFSQFVTNDHHKLLHKVFSSAKCISGLHILKAILDACCDKPIIQFNGTKFQVIQQSDAVIVNSFLISTILSSWKDWSRSDQENEVLGVLFAALHALLKDEHPYREFNVSQLNRVRMVDGLLYFCKERLLYEEKKNLSDEVCYSLVELVRSLMGAPPEFSHVVAVMDCLILLHPVNATYITHVKNSFYLLLSAGQTYSSQALAHEPKPRTLSTESDSSKSSHILDNWIFNFNFNSQMKRLSKQEFTQPVDPAKLNKALANLQLKQSCSEPADKDENKKQPSEDLDSNRYSDELTLDSGIAGSYREHVENVEESDEIIVKATDGSKQNLNSFFPSILTSSEGKVSDLNDVSDEEEKYTSENNQKEIQLHEDCGPQCLITEGLLLLLRDTVSVLPDNMAHQVLNHVVKLESLLVMANHKDHRVRSAVVKVLCAYMQRSSDEEINKFIRIRGFHHLANQISLFPASIGLVEDCLQLLTRRNMSLEDQNFINQFEFTSMEMACLPPLMALLPRSVHDSLLARNLLNILKIIYCKDVASARVLFENGLLEVLVKALVASAHVVPDINDITNQDLIIFDIHYFFAMILNQVLNTPGFHNMQIITDIRLELNYVYRLEKEKCGPKARCVRVVRDTLCKLLEKALDIMQDKITSLHLLGKSKSSFFSSVLSTIQPENSGELDRLSVRTGSSQSNSNSSSSITNLVASNVPVKEVSRGELTDRFKILIVNSIEFLIYSEPYEGKYSMLSQIELNFIYHLVPLLLQILSSTLEKRSYGRRPACNGIYWAVRDTLKTETAELLVWLLSPRHMIKTRMFAVNSLMSEPKCKDVISVLLLTHPQIEQKFIMFLWDLMYNNKLAGQDLRSCQELKESLQSWGLVSSQSIGNCHDVWGDECNMLVNEMNKQMAAWEKQTEAATMRCITKHDALIKGMGEEAMSMTRVVVDAQNSERKSLMEQIKLRYSESIQMAGKWNQLISQLTHEKGVWFFKKSYPMLWQLDPTEGPSRVRKRLSRCHINIDERYLLPSQRHKLEPEKCPEPLSYLFEKHKETCTSSVLIERLHCNEKIRTMTPAKVVTPANEIPGELLIGETCLYFVADNRKKFQSFDAFSTAWSFEDVKEIHNRRYQLQERAIEIFLINGKTYLIAFQTSKERDALMAELLDCNLPNRVSGDNLADVMQLWREGLITNWDYLTQLNKMAGRSFNDLMQYPVFPFVLSDYTSQTLDLTNPTVYRNFKKPMAVQDKKNEQHYVNNYNELMGGLKQVTLNKEPYHYGSHYSNSGTVLHFLVRLPPFTKMLLQYQDRNFDLPDRTFHSMHTTWRLASCDSTTDVKEMLPEFFYLPEFLLNSQGFNFGVRQNGEIVDDVELPPWCRGEARRFILIHRQALESDYATENLPHWIDLVFGYKQTGKAAVDAINVFHPATYCGFDVESISDPLERTAWETMVKTYGQTPRQLFRTPHPLVVQSLVSTSNASGLMINDIKGLKWGNYVGSPAEPEPSIVWKQQSKDKTVVAKLLPLISNDVFGLPKSTTSLLRYNKEKGLNLVNSPAIRAALVSWGHSNGIVRLKVKKEQPPIPLVYISQLDPISVCESVPECNQLWIGHSSGNITVYKFNFVPDRDLLEFSSLPTCLQGHSQAVVSLSICRPFSIVVCGGQDGTVIIWDLNHITYVRSIELNTSPLKLLAVSDTLGDIVTVSQGNDKDGCDSVLNVYTINATFVASTSIKAVVTAVCYSAAPEGVSINVIACGLSNGVIRLFSSWDLTHVRDIISSSLIHPVVSLAYSYDAQHLYASFSDGTVVVWEGSGAKYNGKTPKFMNLASLK